MSEINAGGNISGQMASVAEFEGFVECRLFSEEAAISVETDGLLIAAMFDQLPIRYGEIKEFALINSRMELETIVGAVTFSRMGGDAQWFYQKLCEAYNAAVEKALLVEGSLEFQAEGDYMAEENGIAHQGHAVIRLYEDCLLILPPNENARRIPLCFLIRMDKGDYSITISLATGERYILQKLGRELDDLERRLTDNLRKLRERTMAFHRELDQNLGSMQSAMATKLMPLGTAANLNQLDSIAPSLAAVLENQIKESRMVQTYSWLKELCGGQGLVAGILPIKKKPEEAQTDQDTTPDMRSAQMEIPTSILWIIAPDSESRVAAVELALADNEAAATYLYRVEGQWENFARQIDRALEAVKFQREMILLSDEELNMPEHMSQAMLVRRTPLLALVRSCFVGRAIHSSLNRWQKDIEKCRAAISDRDRT